MQKAYIAFMPSIFRFTCNCESGSEAGVTPTDKATSASVQAFEQLDGGKGAEALLKSMLEMLVKL